MKKYKHKNTGIIGEVKHDGWLHFERCHGNVCSQESISMELIENSNDWEEMVDNNPLKLEVGKTYKIQYKHCLSSIQTVTVTRFTKQGFPWSDDIGGIITDAYNLIEEVVKKDYEVLVTCPIEHTIYSVKRLSDSEIFTVGDYIKMQWCSKKGIIESIYHNEHNQLSFKIKGSEAPLTSVFTEKHPIKLKQKLFTTEDGVEVSKGDIIYKVMKGSFCMTSEKYNGQKENSYCLYFANEESAKEYILLNNPCLSINDVVNSYSGLYNAYKEHTINNLTKLVKSKLE